MTGKAPAPTLLPLKWGLPLASIVLIDRGMGTHPCREEADFHKT